MGQQLLSLLAGTLLAACSPVPWSAPDIAAPLAFRIGSDGAVEALLTRCTPGRLARFEVFEGKGVFDGDELPLWAIEFEPPTRMQTVVLGKVPRRVAETIPWKGLEADPDRRHVVRITYDDGKSWFMSFARSDLEGGRVRFNSRSVLPEQFASMDTCEGPR